ncbi:MAG: type II toxin-antitoxin system Phd/YefM family antitoxin [Nitrospinae bacterium]|nr:type II toxin-antitoxin system Phd/YefM family antitoxin [Nitrospinota bacterium]MBI5748519.1 type II toxin-antitoxin system Phd/YefM family antitoxin [Nitrospinota bacterium]
MKLSEDVKPISYFKSHASEVIRDIVKGHKTVVITQNGEAKVIVQNINDYEKIQESLALLKILAQSRKNLEEGKTKPFREAFRDLRKKAAGFREK